MQAGAICRHSPPEPGAKVRILLGARETLEYPAYHLTCGNASLQGFLSPIPVGVPMPLPAGHWCREESSAREGPASAAHQVGQPRSEMMAASTEPARQLALPLWHPPGTETAQPGCDTAPSADGAAPLPGHAGNMAAKQHRDGSGSELGRFLRPLAARASAHAQPQRARGSGCCWRRCAPTRPKSPAGPWTSSPPTPGQWRCTRASATGRPRSATSAGTCSSIPRRATSALPGTTGSAAASPGYGPWPAPTPDAPDLASLIGEFLLKSPTSPGSGNATTSPTAPPRTTRPSTTPTSERSP